MPDFRYIPVGELGFTLDPEFAAPYEFLCYYAPKQNWDFVKSVTWEVARDFPGMLNLITDVKKRSLVVPPLFIKSSNEEQI